MNAKRTSIEYISFFLFDSPAHAVERREKIEAILKIAKFGTHFMVENHREESREEKKNKHNIPQ